MLGLTPISNPVSNTVWTSSPTAITVSWTILFEWMAMSLLFLGWDELVPPLVRPLKYQLPQLYRIILRIYWLYRLGSYRITSVSILLLWFRFQSLHVGLVPTVLLPHWSYRLGYTLVPLVRSMLSLLFFEWNWICPWYVWFSDQVRSGHGFNILVLFLSWLDRPWDRPLADSDGRFIALVVLFLF